MKNLLLILFLLLPMAVLRAVASPAAAPDSLTVWGNVHDVYDYKCLLGAQVEFVSLSTGEVLVSDSTRDITLKFDENSRRYYRRISSPEDRIKYTVRMLPGNYLMRVRCKGYAPFDKVVTVPAKQNGRKIDTWKADDVKLQRVSERQLGEAVVTATKIMMVNKGDTVVFNADYFQLAQGNMLDKLVSMIPGLEIKGGGQIFYQGNPLSTLLVNGKNFFKGDASVALRNLPAYMVNTVNIYHKDADDAYLDSRRDTTDKRPNTLDIRLKKEYDHGWVTNFELAGGPALGTSPSWDNAKYLARAFGHYMGKRMGLTVMGNVNNINDTKTAGGDGSWSDSWTPENGVTKMSFAGANFNTESYNRMVNFNSDVRFAHETTQSESSTSGTTFLPSGDVYRRAQAQGSNNRRHLSSTNELRVQGRSLYFISPLVLEYWNRHIRNTALSAQFDDNPLDNYRGASLDSIFLGPQSQRLQQMLINRLSQQSLSKTTDLNLKYQPFLTVRIPGIDLLWRNWVTLKYDFHLGHDFEHYDLQYKHTGSDYRNRYFSQPSHAFNAKYGTAVDLGKLIVQPFWSKLLYRISYDFEHNYTSGHRNIYNLQNLDESDRPASLGLLPSADNWRDASIDVANSYFQRRTDDTHNLGAVFTIGDDAKKGRLELKPNAKFYHHQYADIRRDRQTSLNKRYAFLTAGVSYNLIRDLSIEQRLDTASNGKYLQYLYVDYNFDKTPANIAYLVDVRDDSNPLSISLGNAGLKGTSTHDLSLSYRREKIRKNAWRIGLSYNKVNDAMAMACRYDALTGVYTYRPENVDGNWSTNANVYYLHFLGPKKLWTLNSITSWDYLHSVDLMDGQRSTVCNHQLTEDFIIVGRISQKATVRFRASANWYYATSARENYRTRNSWDFHYGPDLSLRLKHDLTLGTDFNVYQRTGYDDRSMNDCDLIWNASLSWDFDFRRSSYYDNVYDGFIRTRKRGGTGARPWTLRIIGHDILQQLNTTRRTINAQGITETRFNAAPAYVMLSISYRFTRMPKSRSVF